MQRILVKTSVLLLFMSFQLNSYAALKDVALGIGTQTQFVGKVQTNEAGSTNKFEFNPYLTAQAEIPFTESFSFFPEFGFLIPDSTRDPLISKMTFFVLGGLGYAINDWVLRIGLGLQMTRISGKGGTQVLDNGTGQTSFPMPDSTATSRNVITNLGVDYFFHSDWSARVESTIYNPINSRNRSFGYQLAVQYHFHDLFGGSKKAQSKTKSKIKKKENKKGESEWLNQ